MTTPLPLWPDGARVVDGALTVGGIALESLAERYGTPLYLYDAPTIRGAYRAYRRAFAGRGPVRVSYAVKACGLIAVGRVLAERGAEASAASLGEVLAARRAGFRAAAIQLHGNAKTDEELRGAIRAGVGRIVVDGADEIVRLAAIVGRRRDPLQVWLRLSPGIDVDTHAALRTATLDSKFGAPIVDGTALALVREIARLPSLSLVGIHAHLGTQLHEPDRYRELAHALVAFAHEVRDATGVRLRELAVGGGLGIPLREGDRTLSLEEYARAVTGPVRADPLTARATIVVEPGRSLVGRAGVALYRVVGTKRVPGVRTFVAVDGGMGDNIRPALYGARYTAVLAARMTEQATETVTLAGRFCESGDLLAHDITMPVARRDDVVAIPSTGAYAVAMASSYNHVPRPAVVMIDGGRARIVRRRETPADLWRLERR